ncbi:MAG: hypothetical protein RMZ41_001700 [Nostoc sp. DedVER02]|uniref:hypothetical protein n=1 Tax=unclassified Nostoc TaxID=2593658 RepID=UPI002AD221FF|nr:MULTISPECIES: hypothetical protein [unclassified Nostoc]MDZ7987126.1 hypothetical protein [Nostoc sp. DedVER02]MDZ8111004.1 hypothetical protein [Nostoc sp. DedVER01b]
MSINNNVLKGLPNAERITDIYAYLIDELGQVIYSFLYNPEEKSFSRSAKYNQGITALTSIPSQQYGYTSGLTLQLDNLLLESHSEGKTCKLLLQKLQALMVADPAKGKYAPSPVTFKWGKDSFGPAVITDIKWAETAWLGGEVAQARLDITLLEIPSNQLPNKAKSESTADRLQSALSKSNLLTDRQIQEGNTKAVAWLKANVKKLPTYLSTLVKSNKYKVSVAKNGTVSMFDSKGKSLGTIGLYKNDKLDVSTGNLIKK